jgi:hypothetical protein
VSGPQKVAGFILGLAVVFVAAFGIGATLGPENGAGALPAGHGQAH